MLERAVVVSEGDLRALARAGAVIVGTVTARGNGFAGTDYVAEAIAEEGARHGGTHVVLGMTLHESPRGRRLQRSGGSAMQAAPAPATYYPGKTVELRALVLRLPDDASAHALPAELQLPRAARAARPPPPARAPRAEPAVSPAPDAAVAHLEPLPDATAAGAAPQAVEIDGSHIAPLPPGGE